MKQNESLVLTLSFFIQSYIDFFSYNACYLVAELTFKGHFLWTRKNDVSHSYKVIELLPSHQKYYRTKLVKTVQPYVVRIDRKFPNSRSGHRKKTLRLPWKPWILCLDSLGRHISFSSRPKCPTNVINSRQ